MKWIEMSFQERKVRVLAQSIQGVLWIHCEGRTFTHEVHTGSSRKRSGIAGSESKDVLVAPMPGRVTKLFVEPGQTVEVGQALVVMEAMKMEYTLKSEVRGRVMAVTVQIGDIIPLHTVIVKMKELAEGE